MKKIVISNSMLRTLTSCDTKARLQTEGWSTVAQENKRMRAGSDASLAFEHWLKGNTPSASTERFRHAYQEYSDKYLLDNDAYHLGNLSRILEIFFATNPLPALPFQVIETENQLELELFRTKTCIYSVSDKSDAVVRMADTGDLLSMEHKTTGHIGENYLNDYSLDSQITCHVAACRANGRDVKGVLLQILQFNKLPDPLQVTPKTKKPASCRISGHGYVKDCWALHVRFERFALTRTEEEIEVWRKNTKELILKYEDILNRPLDEVAQQGLYGKCGSCDYLKFCQSFRRNFDGLVKRPRKEGILYSGIYKAEKAQYPREGNME